MPNDQIESTNLVLATTNTPFGLFNEMGSTYSAKYNNNTGEYDIHQSRFVAQDQPVVNVASEYRQQVSALRSADGSISSEAKPIAASIIAGIVDSVVNGPRKL